MVVVILCVRLARGSAIQDSAHNAPLQVASLSHLDKSEEASISEASSIASDLPAYSYDRPPGLPQADTPRATSDPGHTPLAKP